MNMAMARRKIRVAQDASGRRKSTVSWISITTMHGGGDDYPNGMPASPGSQVDCAESLAWPCHHRRRPAALKRQSHANAWPPLKRQSHANAWRPMPNALQCGGLLSWASSVLHHLSRILATPRGLLITTSSDDCCCLYGDDMAEF
jgi:hypothetical protein